MNKYFRKLRNVAFNNGFQEAERKIPINYASRFTSKSGGLEKSAYLPFKVLVSFTHLFITI